MHIHWFHLVVGLLLLWLPRSLLRMGKRVGGGARRRRGVRRNFTDPSRTRAPGDESVGFRDEFRKLRNHLDFFRAALGSLALTGAMPGLTPAFEPTPEAGAGTTLAATLLPLALILVGPLVQFAAGWRRRGSALFAPLFFLGGLTFGLCGAQAALFAWVLIWALNLALPSPLAFLALHALLIFVFGLLFNGIRDRMTMYAAFLLFLPVLVSLLSRRPLLMQVHHSRRGASS